MHGGGSFARCFPEGRAGALGQVRPQYRCRSSQHVVPKVAQGNFETAAGVHDVASTFVSGVSPLTTAVPAEGIASIGVGATASSSGRPYNGQPPPGVTDVGPLSIDPAGTPHTSVSSSSSSTGRALNGHYSSHNGDTGHSSQQQEWQPPRYRREGLRIRSKREVHMAQRAQGQNLVVEDLQKLLRSSRVSSSSNSSSTPSDVVDSHLETFIEQVLCPKLNVWELKKATPPAPDGSQAVPAEVLNNISSISADEVAQLQADLARNGQFSASLLLLEEAVAAGRMDVVAQTSHRAFLRAAGAAQNTRAVLRFLQLLPVDYADAKTYNMAVKACSTAKDLPGALKVIDMMAIRQVPCDYIHFTTLITVCAAAGDVNQAFTVFQKAKAAQQQLQQAAAAAGKAKAVDQQLDSQIYGALIAACAQGIKARSSDRKDQLVVLDRAFQVLQEAMDSGVHLETPVWNALLMCAGKGEQ
eukprot:GHUV01009775.1.p2 GENE.GHUV01009775.1~~GHUV01009775.1.p2  ORF type:complete len:470 (+),score=146.39 GHUV01009775.1:319-1728(+)